MQREQEEKIASERKLQVGAGDRAERIRTYNYPQGRVTDHRIGLTLYKLEQILNGDLTELFDALNTFDQAEKAQGKLRQHRRRELIAGSAEKRRYHGTKPNDENL